MVKRKKQSGAVQGNNAVGVKDKSTSTSTGKAKVAFTREIPRKWRGFGRLRSKSPEDRFDIRWNGDRDSRALRYAVDNDLSYWRGGSKVKDLKDGLFLVNADGGLDEEALYEANKGYNDDTRERHRRDADFSTGVSLGEKLYWRDRTRGQKLRRCEILIASHEHQLARYEKSQKNLATLVKKRPDEIEGIKRVRGDVDRLVRLHIEVLTQAALMKCAVLEEAGPDWDWKKGLQNQEKIEDKWRELDQALNRENSPPVSEIDALDDCREQSSDPMDVKSPSNTSKDAYIEANEDEDGWETENEWELEDDMEADGDMDDMEGDEDEDAWETEDDTESQNIF